MAAAAAALRICSTISAFAAAVAAFCLVASLLVFVAKADCLSAGGGLRGALGAMSEVKAAPVALLVPILAALAPVPPPYEESPLGPRNTGGGGTSKSCGSGSAAKDTWVNPRIKLAHKRAMLVDCFDMFIL